MLTFMAVFSMYYFNFMPLNIIDSSASHKNVSSSHITYEKDIKPIINRHCSLCHNGMVPFRKNLRKYEVAYEYGEIMLEYMSGNGKKIMPPTGRLANEKIEKVRLWVAGGKLEK